MCWCFCGPFVFFCSPIFMCWCCCGPFVYFCSPIFMCWCCCGPFVYFCSPIFMCWCCCGPFVFFCSPSFLCWGCGPFMLFCCPFMWFSFISTIVFSILWIRNHLSQLSTVDSPLRSDWKKVTKQINAYQTMVLSNYSNLHLHPQFLWCKSLLQI